jgi:hypothetical protein
MAHRPPLFIPRLLTGLNARKINEESDAVQVTEFYTVRHPTQTKVLMNVVRSRDGRPPINVGFASFKEVIVRTADGNCPPLEARSVDQWPECLPPKSSRPGTDWVKAGVTHSVGQHMLVRNLVERDDAGRLTDQGRAVLSALLSRS